MRSVTLAGRLTIIGGGVMGLMTAYHAAAQAQQVTVIDRSQVGDPATASFGLTRSVRNDYRDPGYARLASEARRLWRELERDCGQRLLVDSGCLNLFKATVTPDLDSSYAAESYAVLEQLQLRREAFTGAQLKERFPQFDADGGWLDVDAGFADLAAVTAAVRAGLQARGVQLIENCEPRGISRSGPTWTVHTDAGPVESDALVVTAGLGTNDILSLVPGCSVRFPLSPDRPTQSKYFIPPPGSEHMFTESVLPVFAYLDIGIYGHPIYEGKTPGVKIGFYNPPDVVRTPSPVGSVEQFVAECLPGLRDAEVVDVAVASGVDTCWYDLVADDEFILGAVPGADGLYTGVGWRGTGYKFAPWVGRVLAQLALQQGTVYDIRRFTPARFAADEIEGAQVA
jgi:sarcosine oxidase